MLQEGSTASPLCVSRHFAARQREVAAALDRKPSHINRFREAIENRPEAPPDIAKLGTRNERHGDRVIEAAGADDHRPAPGEAAQHRGSVAFAGVDDDVIGNLVVSADDDDRSEGLPRSEERVR